METENLEMESLTPDAEKLAVWRGTVIEALRHIQENLDNKASQEAFEYLKDRFGKCIAYLARQQGAWEKRFNACADVETLEKLERRVKILEQEQHKTDISNAGIVARLGVYGALGGAAVTVIIFLVEFLMNHVLRGGL